MKERKNIESLFQKYLDDQCTPDEIGRLLKYFDAEENEELLKKLICRQGKLMDDTPAYSERFESLLNTSFSNIKQAIAADKNTTLSRPLYKLRWFRLSAAAVVIFMLFGAAFHLLHQKNETAPLAKNVDIRPEKDIPPGHNNAVLTLDNGASILLDTAANGTLARQGNSKVLKLNGRVAYNKTGDMNAKPVYNTITTANGNQYQLILTDGTKVWLNAASSIRFPTAFSGKERRVKITGEVYFEVAHDRTKPFKVEFSNASGKKGEVEVLGTHFDVNAYPDEKDIKTTLLEGSVRIRQSDNTQMLSPGQQAIIRSDAIILRKDVDVAQVTAWKDGYFLFNNTDIQTIMRQVARWYDADVTFEGKIPADGFTGKISRNVPLSKFVKVLELNDLKVKTEGRKVTVIF